MRVPFVAVLAAAVEKAGGSSFDAEIQIGAKLGGHMDPAGVGIALHDDAGHDAALGQAHVQKVVAQQRLPVVGAQRQRKEPVPPLHHALDSPGGDQGIFRCADHRIVGVKGVLAVVKILAHLLVQVVQNEHIRPAAHSTGSGLHGLDLHGIFLTGYDQKKFSCTEPDPVAYDDIRSVLNCLFHSITRSNAIKRGIKIILVT